MTQNNDEAFHKIMAQVQVYASSYSLVGTRFASDNQLEKADSEKLALYNMVKSALSQSPISQNEQQEPFAYTDLDEDFMTKFTHSQYEKMGLHITCTTPLYTSPPKQIPDGWIEPQRVKVAIDEFRDLVLNQRGLLAENGMTNDMVNDVLSEFDYYFHDIKCAVPPAPINTEVRKLVPIDITPEMIELFFNELVSLGYSASKIDLTVDELKQCYKAMISAAPTTSLTSETNMEVGND